MNTQSASSSPRWPWIASVVAELCSFVGILLMILLRPFPLMKHQPMVQWIVASAAIGASLASGIEAAHSRAAVAVLAMVVWLLIFLAVIFVAEW